MTKYDAIGWLILDGKAVFVKCRYYGDSKKLVRVCVPRRYRLGDSKGHGGLIIKNQLHKSAASAIRRQIKIQRAEFTKQKDALMLTYAVLEELNSAICSLREQLQRVRK